MCRHDNESGEREEHGHRHHRGPGFRGFGRRGFPSSEEWIERLQAYEQRLQEDLKNVQELIGRLGATAAPSTEGTSEA
jgi:hypothetical protein